MQNTTEEDAYIVQSGYKPELHRRLSTFASFAITFSVMSVLVGVFAVYSFTLQAAGPFGIWSWPIVVCGQLLIALVFAEMAGRIPLTGSIYNWNAKLGSPTLGWQAGWLIVFSYSVGGVAAIVALMTPLQSLLGITLSSTQMQIWGAIIILSQLIINIYGVKVAGQLNRLAVIIEIALISLLSVALVVLAAFHGNLNFSLVTHIPTSPVPYWQGFLAGSLLGMLTLIGFESASDVSEETINARSIAPRSIVRGVAFSGILGFIFIFILTIIIPNVTQITASSDPVSAIVGFYLGTAITKIFLACVVLAIFAASLLIITYVSRLIFAVARDGRIMGSQHLGKVSSRGIPVSAAVLVAVVEIVILIIAFGQVALFATNAVLTALVYLVTVINFWRANKKLPENGTFSLGKWRKPVTIAAIIWLIFEVGILTLPKDFHPAAFLSIGVVVGGFIVQRIFGGKKNSTA